MESSREIQTALSAFLTYHFILDGRDWNQQPHLDALFTIYRGAIDNGWGDEDFRHHIQKDWPLQHVNQLSSETQAQVKMLCDMLAAWIKYERCQSSY